MYTFKCEVCGKVMQAQKKDNIRMTCSNLCLREIYSKRKGTRGLFTRPTNRDLHPDGMNHLIEAIVKSAKNDVLNYSPGNENRKDAERFFLSDYFRILTNMDGETVLRKLHCIYDMRQKQKRRVKK